MKTAVALDTEFTDLIDPDLVSLALVAEDGSELYLELGYGAWTIRDCSEFVRAAVLPLLDPDTTTRVSAPVAAHRIRGFLETLGANLVLWTDAPNYDIVLLRELVGDDLPPFNVKVPVFDTDRERAAFSEAVERAFAGGLRRHHALDDARAMMAGMRAVWALPSMPVHEALSPDFASRIKAPPV